MKDKYDKAVEYLTTHPEKICETWNSPVNKAGGILFLPAAPYSGDNLFPTRPDDTVRCGCLTLVHRGSYVASER